MFKEYIPQGFSNHIFKRSYAIHQDETFKQACERVSRCVSDAEQGVKRDEYFARFLNVTTTNRFCPGGRIWRGAGRPRGQMLNCFVWTDDLDSREGWGDVLRAVAIISGTGGGVGINFSKVRPRGTPIRGTGGEATGAVSLMRAINAVCNELREGGGRRSALMFCLNYDHPDLPEFLSTKLDKQELNNANISVCIDENFLHLLDTDQDVVLKWDGKEQGLIKAKEVWDKIVINSWKIGDPGLLNIGLANEMNTISYLANVISTNPCGEIWMIPYDCCCLGAVNLYTHVKDGQVDWDALEETVALGVRFLDNVLDQNHYPLPIIQETCQKFRRIGLGVMGLHDMLLELGYRYSTEEARKFVDKVIDFIKKRAYDTSITLAVEKGAFRALDREKHVKTGFAKKCLTQSHRRRILEHGIRNCALLTIAPTGTTSIVAGVTSGIEPMFQPVYRRNFNEHKPNDTKLSGSEVVIHPLVKKFIEANRSMDHFENTHEIDPDQHLAMQVVCQKHIDNSISKTINLPEQFPVEKLSTIMKQYISELKGITVYRDGSRGQSPLVPVDMEEIRNQLQNLESGKEVIVEEVSDLCVSGACNLGD